MSSRKKNKGTPNKNTRKNKPVIQLKTIDDYLKDNIFPILSNEYITIELETCKEGNETQKYNYKVSNVNKKAFQDVPDYNEYPTLTMETLQEGINKLELKTPNSFIRLMLISGTDGLKIYKLDNQQYKPNTNNKEKCGYGTSIYEELIPMAYDADSFVEPVVLEPIQNEGLVNEQQEQIVQQETILPEPGLISEPARKVVNDIIPEAEVYPKPEPKPEPEPEPELEPEPKPELEPEPKSEPEPESKYDDEPDNEAESESDDEESIDETWPTTAPSQGLLNMIDEIRNQVETSKYEDNKLEIIDNMVLVKAMVDELYKISNLLTPISPIPIILGKSKCNTALNYIKNNHNEDIYNDHLYDDYTKVNSKYETYVKYKTSWLSDNFEEHKQNFINELENFKKNLVEKVYSTFEYGDGTSEYCQNKSTNNDDEFIKSVEAANAQAETVFTKDDSSITKREPTNQLLRSKSVPNIKMNNPVENSTYKSIVKEIFLNIDKSNKFPGKGKDIFIKNVGVDINKLLQNPNIKDKKELHDILFHLSNYVQTHDSTPEQITHYLDRVKTHLTNIYGGNTKKHTKKKKQMKNSRNCGTRKGKIQRKK